MKAQQIQDAVKYRELGKFDKAHDILIELLVQEPNDSVVNYQMAWLHDTQGKEREAVPYYEQAITNGLDGDDLRGALLGLGSTYRCLGRYDEAAATLRRGMEIFPSAKEFPVFLAMTLYNKEQYAESVGMLLQLLAESTQDDGILAYRRAITYYHDKLDNIWDT